MDFNRLLAGKTAFITTGARGIGKEIAMLFARQGASIILGGRNQGQLEATIEEICAISPGSKGYVVDLSQQAQVEAAVERIKADFDNVDILVHTVGINTQMPVHICADDLIRQIIQTNYVSSLVISRAFLPGMMERGQGNIINISSIHGTRTMPGYGIYAGTKGAMEATARAMALDYAHYGIRVNTIAPGLILSDVLKDEIHSYPEGEERDAFMETLTGMQPLAPGHMDDVAYGALYLASPMSKYVTGQTIFIDGGASIKAH